MDLDATTIPASEKTASEITASEIPASDSSPDSAADSYIHTALDDASFQIRLLHLLPGESEDEICCTIDTYDVASAPRYKAISYTWGSPDSPRSILVNGKPFEVQQNCHYALWQARLHYPGTLVWIDSICIRQNDLAEKGKQVAMMGELYAKSEKVLACVGPHDETSRSVVHLLGGLDPVRRTYLYENVDINSAVLAWKDSQTEATLSNLRQLVKTFSTRPYWSRLWILQELYGGLPDRIVIMCGVSTLAFHVLSECMWYINALEEEEKDTTCFGTILGWWGNLPGLHLGDLRELVLFGCEDPRDRSYGILRLLQGWPRFAPRITPDYTITTFELATRVLDLITFPRGLHSCLSSDRFEIPFIHNIGSVLRCLLVSGSDVRIVAKRLTQDRSHASGLLEAMAMHSLVQAARRIAVDNAGRLSVHAASKTIIDVPNGFTGPHTPAPGSHPSQSLLRLHGRQDGCLPNSTDGAVEVVALLDCDVLADDLLLVGYPFQCSTLVVRDLGDSGLAVVGQALWLQGESELLGRRLESPNESENLHGQRILDIQIGKLDAMLAVTASDQASDFCRLTGPIPVYAMSVVEDSANDSVPTTVPSRFAGLVGVDRRWHHEGHAWSLNDFGT